MHIINEYELEAFKSMRLLFGSQETADRLEITRQQLYKICRGETQSMRQSSWDRVVAVLQPYITEPEPEPRLVADLKRVYANLTREELERILEIVYTAQDREQ